MFSKLSVFATAALLVRPPFCGCRLGEFTNCSLQTLAAAIVGLDLSGILVDVGLSCSPITIVGNNW
jgi:hypothetical protein